MPKAKPSAETYLDDALRIIRECIAGCPNLTVWQGDHEHRCGWREPRVFKTVLAGPTDNTESGLPPTVDILKAWREPGATGVYMDYNTGDEDRCSIYTHFGGGHEPLVTLRELAMRLRTL